MMQRNILYMDRSYKWYHQVSTASGTTNWIWSGQYVQFGSQNKDGALTKRQFLVHVPGKLVYPLGPMITHAPDTYKQSDAQISITCSIQETQLDEILGYAWETLNPSTEEIISNIEMLPTIQGSSLPYCNQSGMSFSLLSAVHHTK
jgi:hypothetical protein